jgi:hypothetical protein
VCVCLLTCNGVCMCVFVSMSAVCAYVPVRVCV